MDGCMINIYIWNTRRMIVRLSMPIMSIMILYLLKVYLLNHLLNILMIFAVKPFFVSISVKCLMRASIVLRCGTKP